MCGNSSNRSLVPEDDLTISSSLSRRPLGTRRRQLEWLTNFVLIIVSLLGCSVGAGLIGFYQLHLLTFISPEFFVVPLVLLGGGAFTLMVSMIGLLATSRRSPILLRFYAFMLVLAFIVLLGGVACSIRVVFIIHIGVNHSLAVPLIRKYGMDPTATNAWDNLHETYRCCGAETSFDLGYMAWEDNHILKPSKAVPDSCCLKPTKGCGKDLFNKHSLKKMAEYVKKIHVHGCLHAMDKVLKGHVVKILLVFAFSGVFLAMVELLGVVLACCLASFIADENKEKKRLRRINQQHLDSRISLKVSDL